MGSGAYKAVKRTGAIKLHTPPGTPEAVQPYFRALAKRVADHGLTQADGPMLAQLATALWMADESAKLLATEGLVVADSAHNLEARKHPATTIWRAAVATADALAKQFGMTPASRTRLGLDEDDGEPTLAEVLFKEVKHDAGG